MNELYGNLFEAFWSAGLDARKAMDLAQQATASALGALNENTRPWTAEEILRNEG